jgi:carboxymethylenebutenolidase
MTEDQSTIDQSTGDQPKISQPIIDLYDSFTHGRINRRGFLDRLGVLAGGAAGATVVLAMLKNNYALAETVPADDSRLHVEKVKIGEVSGYLAKPASGDKFPTVIVIHENRGLNAHIEDVARRLAVAGFMAYAPDLLSRAGGTPSDEDKAREMIGTLQASDVVADLRSIRAALAQRPDSNGKVGVVGFCWGGGFTNALAVADPDLKAAVAYYGRQPKAAEVSSIQAHLLLHYAGLDSAINAGIPDYEKALKADGKTYQLYIYPNVNHAFNNDTNTARYNKEAADLAWGRTLDFLKQNLA